MAFFVKLLFQKRKALSFPEAAVYAKIIALGATLEASRRGKLSTPVNIILPWANEWLAPDFNLLEKKKTIVLYDLKRHLQWLDQPVQMFYDTLLNQSYLRLILQKMKRNDLKALQFMAKGFAREIENYLDNHAGNLTDSQEDQAYFDSNNILWKLWLQAIDEI